MPHDHGHAHIDATSGDRRASIAIWANALLTVAQIVGGILSGSLAHNSKLTAMSASELESRKTRARSECQ